MLWHTRPGSSSGVSRIGCALSERTAARAGQVVRFGQHRPGPRRQEGLSRHDSEGLHELPAFAAGRQLPVLRRKTGAARRASSGPPSLPRLRRGGAARHHDLLAVFFELAHEPRDLRAELNRGRRLLPEIRVLAPRARNQPDLASLIQSLQHRVDDGQLDSNRSTGRTPIASRRSRTSIGVIGSPRRSTRRHASVRPIGTVGVRPIRRVSVPIDLRELREAHIDLARGGRRALRIRARRPRARGGRMVPAGIYLWRVLRNHTAD